MEEQVFSSIQTVDRQLCASILRKKFSTMVDFSNLFASGADVYLAFIGFVCVLVLAPISLYYFKRFYDAREHVVIAKRQWQIVAAQIVATVLFLLVERPLALLYASSLTATDSEWMYLLDRALYLLFLHCDLDLIVLRFWSVHYEINFNASSSMAYWHGLIQHGDDQTEKLQRIQSNFYLAHRSTFGSASVLRHLTLVAVAVSASLCFGAFVLCFLAQGHPLCDVLFSVFEAAALMLAVLLILLIVRHTPSMQDVFSVKREMELASTLAMFGAAFYILWLSLALTTLADTSWLEALSLSISCLLYFSLNVMPMLWLFHYSDQSATLRGDTERSRIRTLSTPNENRVYLSRLLSTQHGFACISARSMNN